MFFKIIKLLNLINLQEMFLGILEKSVRKFKISFIERFIVFW